MPNTPMPDIPFDNSYARLPGQLYTRLQPEPVPEPRWIRLNHELAGLLGLDLDWLQSDDGLQMLAGNRVPEGAEPIATVYAGHQFGSWNPQLGDGRALLLGEVIARDGERYDIQLKGSGRTPYSRGGDGKSPLGPVLREYIVSEAMAVLGIPTTRALAAVTTGEEVYRETALPGAVLTRVAKSHIRIGTAQFFASRRDEEALRALADHVIERHYPQALTPSAGDADNPYLALLDGVIARQAKLIAQWQLIGFIHGVMNTDNMLLSGETIDYGPCAFMDTFDPATVYSSIDHGGRYAYGNQPGIAHWNLAGFAQAILPLLDADQDKAVELAQDSVNAFPNRFVEAYQQGMARKLGLAEYRESDDALVKELLETMQAEKADFTLCFRRLAELADETGDFESVKDLFEFSEAFAPWLEQWRARLAHDTLSPEQRQAMMFRANPAFIPRNHQVEKAINDAMANAGYSTFHRLIEVLSEPFSYRHEWRDYALPPRPEEVVRQTFCGT